MLRLLLHRRRDCQQLVHGHADVHEIGDLGAADGERAGLVERQCAGEAEILQVCPALDEHAVPGRLRDPRQDCGGGAQRQSTGRGRYEQGHATVEAELPGPQAQQRRHDDEQDVRHQNERHEDPLEALRELLRRGFLRLRLGHQGHDPVQGAIADGARGRDLERPVAIHRAGKHLGPLGLVDRHGFAGDRRLVHGRLSLQHGAVHGNPLGRPHQHHGACHHLLDRHLVFASVSHHPCDTRRQLAQSPNGMPRAVQRVVLERVRQGEQEEQERTFRPFAERRRTAGSHEHEQIDVEPEPALAQPLDGMTQEIEAAEPIRSDEQRDGHATRHPEPPLAGHAGDQEGAGAEAPGQFLVARIPRVRHGRTVVARPCRGWRRRRCGQAECLDRGGDGGGVRDGAIELEPRHLRGQVDGRLQYARDGPQRPFYPLRRILGGHHMDRQCEMAIALAEARTRISRDLPESRQRHGRGIVVKTEHGGRHPRRPHHVHASHTGLAAEDVLQASGAGIGRVGRFWQQQFQFQAQLLVFHDRCPDGVRVPRVLPHPSAR